MVFCNSAHSKFLNLAGGGGNSWGAKGIKDWQTKAVQINNWGGWVCRITYMIFIINECQLLTLSFWFHETWVNQRISLKHPLNIFLHFYHESRCWRASLVWIAAKQTFTNLRSIVWFLCRTRKSRLWGLKKDIYSSSSPFWEGFFRGEGAESWQTIFLPSEAVTASEHHSHESWREWIWFASFAQNGFFQTLRFIKHGPEKRKQ